MVRLRVVWRERVAVFISWPREGVSEGGGDMVGFWFEGVLEVYSEVSTMDACCAAITESGEKRFVGFKYVEEDEEVWTR